MYAAYYGLRDEPFHITPDPRRLFLTAGHRDAIGAILYGLSGRKGFVVVSGDAGVGKTTVLRHCLAQLPETYEIVYVLQPALPPAELFGLLHRELASGRGDPAPTNWDGVSNLVSAVHAELFGIFDRGRSVVVVIDEAQNMPIETLESLRVLSNLETDTEKLLQIVLVGQTELDHKLARHELRQLDQRVAVRAHIPTLDRTESLQYIEHRLNFVGGTTAALFTDAAAALIVRAARGNPRRLNVLCDNALMNGCGHRAAKVTRHIASEVTAQLHNRSRWRGLVWRSGGIVGRMFDPMRRNAAAANVGRAAVNDGRLSRPKTVGIYRPAPPSDDVRSTLPGDPPSPTAATGRAPSAAPSHRPPVDPAAGLSLPEKTIGFSY